MQLTTPPCVSVSFQLDGTVGAGIVRRVLDYVYTGEVALANVADAQVLLAAAQHFAIPTLTAVCAEYVGKRTSLLGGATPSTDEFFAMDSQRALSAGFAAVLPALTKDDYYTDNDCVVAMLKWVAHNEPARRQHLLRLLEGVDLKGISRETFTKVLWAATALDRPEALVALSLRGSGNST